MIVTEAEAATRWCPFVRESDEDAEHPVAVNRMPPLMPGAPVVLRWNSCLGSACMAWRWEHTPVYGLAPSDPPRGFCGMAYSVRLP